MLDYHAPPLRHRPIPGRRLVVLITCAAAAVGALFFYFWPAISFYQLTGRFTPISKIDTLTAPVPVNSWSEAGLALSDGRVVQLPGFAKLPKNSTALTQATTSGAELARDGRIYGLVRIHHWCGNDPVQTHIARVDLAQMLVYLKEGQPTTQPSDAQMEYAASTPGGDFSQFGTVIPFGGLALLEPWAVDIRSIAFEHGGVWKFKVSLAYDQQRASAAMRERKDSYPMYCMTSKEPEAELY